MENKLLEQAKDAVAKKYGFENFSEYFNAMPNENGGYMTESILAEICVEYHRLMSEWVSVDENKHDISGEDMMPR